MLYVQSLDRSKFERMIANLMNDALINPDTIYPVDFVSMCGHETDLSSNYIGSRKEA